MMLRITIACSFVMAWLLMDVAYGSVTIEPVTYMVAGEAMESYLAYRDDLDSARPAVMVLHEWYGIREFEKFKARELAEEGYIAMVVDIYGKGVRYETNSDAMYEALKAVRDPKPYITRLQAAYEFLQMHEKVVADRIAIIGYSFGAGVGLEFARSGAPIDVLLCFYGAFLNQSDTRSNEGIQCQLYMFHGTADNVSYCSFEWAKQMMLDVQAVGKHCEVFSYEGIKHGFADFTSRYIEKNEWFEYDLDADRDSWSKTKNILHEILL